MAAAGKWLLPHHVSLLALESGLSDLQNLNLMQNPSCIGVWQMQDSFPFQLPHYQNYQEVWEGD
jgi:hypothetical protein